MTLPSESRYVILRVPSDDSRKPAGSGTVMVKLSFMHSRSRREVGHPVDVHCPVEYHLKTWAPDRASGRVISSLSRSVGDHVHKRWCARDSTNCGLRLEHAYQLSYGRTCCPAVRCSTVFPDPERYSNMGKIPGWLDGLGAGPRVRILWIEPTCCRRPYVILHCLCSARRPGIVDRCAEELVGGHGCVAHDDEPVAGRLEKLQEYWFVLPGGVTTWL